MTPATVVEALDVIEDNAGGNAVTFKAAIFWQGFILEGSKEALGHSIVVTTSFGAHALKQICLSQAISKLTRGVLAAPIGMEESSRSDQPGGQRFVQSGGDDIAMK